jgi:hypothetical protein
MRARHVAATSLFMLLFWACSTLPTLAQGVGAIGGSARRSSGSVWAIV